jgi:hypothetical protein
MSPSRVACDPSVADYHDTSPETGEEENLRCVPTLP